MQTHLSTVIKGILLRDINMYMLSVNYEIFCFLSLVPLALNTHLTKERSKRIFENVLSANNIQIYASDLYFLQVIYLTKHSIHYIVTQYT